MVVLSCFDGMSCGQIALERAGIKVDKYYASEIDKHAIKVTQANYPNTIQLGSITEWKNWNIEQPDMIIGGSPCQGFSFAGKQLNFEDERSKLFFTFAEIIKHYKPKYFLLENVIMKKEYNDVISGILGEIYPECVHQTELFRTGRLEPIEINSALVSAQNRRRLYWTNIQGIKQPEDKGILLKDIIENGEVEKCHTLSNTALNRIDRKTGYKPQIMPDKTGTLNTKNNSGQLSIDNGTTLIPKDSLCIRYTKDGFHKFRNDKKKSSIQGTHVTYPEGKTHCLDNHIQSVGNNITWRKLTPIECERLQTVPDNYTNYVSNSQRYKMLGNGWTVDVIAHIFRGMY